MDDPFRSNSRSGAVMSKFAVDQGIRDLEAGKTPDWVAEHLRIYRDGWNSRSKSTPITRSGGERSDLHHAHGDLDHPQAMQSRSVSE